MRRDLKGMSISYSRVFQTGRPKTRKTTWLMLATAPVTVALSISITSPKIASASNYIWDPSGTGSSDGSGNWDLVTPDWFSGSLPDVVWPNASGATTIAQFGNGGTVPTATVTLNAAGIISNGLTFSTGPIYTLAGNATNALTLGGTTPTVAVNAASANISAVLAGTAGLTMTGTGTLNLLGANTYTGTTSVNSGTIQVNAGGTLGAASLLQLGNAAGSSTAVSNAVFNTNTTLGGITDNTQTAIDALVIANGSVVTDNGVFTLGQTTASPSTNQFLNTYVGTNVPGSGGELDVNGTMTIGANASGTNKINATADFSGLSTLNVNSSSGSLLVGASTNIAGILTLANNTNFVNVAGAYIGVSDGPGFVGNQNAQNGSSLSLGQGTNTIQASTLEIGGGKANGVVSFTNASNGSVVITGTGGGASTSTITVSRGDVGSSSASSAVSSLLLAGHQATVQGGTVVIGTFIGAAKVQSIGSATFDTGTFNASSMQLGVVSGTVTLTGAGGASGSFTLGSSNTSTGVLNVTSSFVLGSMTDTSNTGSFVPAAIANFTMLGGTANIFSNITSVRSGTGNGTTSSNFNLAGGTLNLNGFAIGGAGGANSSNTQLSTFAMPGTGQTAILENLGGTGINAIGGTGASNGGLVMGGAGTLILAGTNSYSGPTTVNTGATLQVGSGALGGSIPATSTITNNGILNFAGSLPINIAGAISGTGAVNHNSTSITTLSASSSYSGGTTINSGTLVINGGLLSTGNVLVNTTGTLAGNAPVGNLTLAGGAIHPGVTSADASFGTLSTTSLTDSSGDMRFDLGGSTSDVISDSGTANFTGGTISLSLDSSPTVSSYTILTATGGITGTPTLATTSIGRTSFALSKVSNSLVITIGGGPANLVWGKLPSGIGDGVTWEPNQANQNWNNAGSPDFFYNADNVTFNDSNTGHNTVTISGQVTPSSVTFSNNSVNYVIGGTGGISGNTGLLVNGSNAAGSVTLDTSNNYTGDTNVNAGTLVLGTGGSIADTNVNVNGGKFNLAGGTLASTNLNISSGSVNLISGSIAGVNVIDSATINVAGVGFTAGSIGGTGVVNLNGNVLNFAGTSTVTPVIQDGTSSGGVNISSGVTTFTNANIYTGTTAVVAGAVLQIGNNSSTGSISQTTPLALAGTLAFNSSSPLNINNTVTGAGVLASLGSGSTALNGNISGFTGSFNIGGGTQLTFNYSSPVTVANNIGVVSNATILNAGKLTLTGTQTMVASAVTYNVSSYVGNMPSGVAADVELTGSLNRSTQGIALIKTGPGVLAISGATDDANFGANVTQGTLLLNKTSSPTVHAIGGGGLNISGGALVQITGTGGDQIFDTAGTVTINDNSTFDVNGQSETINALTLGSAANAGGGTLADNLVNTTPTITLNGTFKLAGNANLFAANGSTMTLVGNGASAGSGATLALTKTGPGTVILAGNTDDANMAGNISQGTLVLNKNTSGGAHALNGIQNVSVGATVKLGNGGGLGGDQIYDGFAGSNFGVFNMNGTFDFNGQNEGFDKITGTGTVINSQPATNSVFTLGTNNLAGATVPDFQGAITGNISLVKLGASATPLELSGSNTYTGFTNVSAGTLQIGDGGAGGSLGTGPTNLATVATNLYFNHSNPALIVSSSISGLGQVLQFGTGSTTFNGSNSYTGQTLIASGTLGVGSAAGLPLAVPANSFFGTDLTLFGGTAMVVNQQATRMAVQLDSLNNGGATIDLNNNALDVHGANANFADIYQQVVTGFANGTWTGTPGAEQIISTSAATNTTHLMTLGVIVNDNGSGSPLFGAGGTIAATFNGVSPGVDDVLVKYTYYGDANLDGRVDASDYSRIDAAFISGGALTGWANGDFNYDGVINGSDYTLIDNAYNRQGAQLADEVATATALIAGSETSAVPEPTTLSLFGIGAAGLLGRRRRRSSNRLVGAN